MNDEESLFAVLDNLAQRLVAKVRRKESANETVELRALDALAEIYPQAYENWAQQASGED